MMSQISGSLSGNYTVVLPMAIYGCLLNGKHIRCQIPMFNWLYLDFR